MRACDSGDPNDDHELIRIIEMIWNQAQGNWTQFKGKVKEKWGRSTVEGLGLIDGNRDILVGQIQNKYAIAREKAEKRIRDWKKTVG
jgi:uncharacterized protein YjbJ (UPF0337 family)